MTTNGVEHGLRLTPRQLEIARLIARGYDTGEIARALHISPEATKMHVNRIAERLDNTTNLQPLRVVRRWAVLQQWLRE